MKPDELKALHKLLRVIERAPGFSLAFVVSSPHAGGSVQRALSPEEFVLCASGPERFAANEQGFKDVRQWQRWIEERGEVRCHGVTNAGRRCLRVNIWAEYTPAAWRKHEREKWCCKLHSKAGARTL
jgi:hypothetical protein